METFETQRTVQMILITAMSFYTTIVFTVVTVCISSLTPGISATSCDLSAVQTCLGSASELAQRIYFNPLDLSLLQSIKSEYCGQNIASCLDNRPNDCSLKALAPYNTITTMVEYVCETDIQAHLSCLSDRDFRYEVDHCFNVFKQTLDNLLANTTLNSTAVDTGLCRAFDEAINCSWYVTNTTCSSADSKQLVQDILIYSTDANVHALGCDLDSGK